MKSTRMTINIYSKWGKNMGIINQAYFKTTDNNYNIILQLSPKKLFSQENNFKFLCEYKIYNNINIPIIDIQCTEIDIIKLIDSFYYALENNLMDMIYTFPSISTNSTMKGFKLEMNPKIINNIGGIDSSNSVYKIIIFEYTNNEQIIKRAILKFYDLSEIYNFLDLSYMVFLKEYYNQDSNILNQIDTDIPTLTSYFEFD